jgi:ABC-type uncharacterized transport system substrate-binding protein|tara:strand:- start:11406 stop:12515 length:1110 start_codon:yes stop_codon:yes gene_type:complete
LIISGALLIITSPANSFAQAIKKSNRIPHIAVTTIIHNSTIDALYRGMKDALYDKKYKPGKSINFTFYDAKANSSAIKKLIDSIESKGINIIVAFTFPAANLVSNHKIRIPLVVAGISQKAVNKLQQNRNALILTGIVDGNNYDTKLKFIKKILPKVKTVVIPVKDKNQLENRALQLVKNNALNINLFIRELPCSMEKSLIVSEIESYSAKDTVILIDKVVFPKTPVDLVISASETNNLLVFSNDQDTVIRGGLAANVSDPYGTGREVGELVANILKNPEVAFKPFKIAKPSYIIINEDTAIRREINLSIILQDYRRKVIRQANSNYPRPRKKPFSTRKLSTDLLFSNKVEKPIKYSKGNVIPLPKPFF